MDVLHGEHADDIPEDSMFTTDVANGHTEHRIISLQVPFDEELGREYNTTQGSFPFDSCWICASWRPVRCCCHLFIILRHVSPVPL